MGAGATLFGAACSVCVRAARLAHDEKGAAYRLVPVDVFAGGGPPAEHLRRHPFGRIPAFEHDGFRLYETGAIKRTVDEAFPGPALQPGSPRERARMNQAIGVLDAYAYRTLVWNIAVERASGPERGRATDEERVRAAVPRAALCLSALDGIMGDGPFPAGPALTLADLHAAPMFGYFAAAAEGRALLAERPRLSAWLGRMDRPSMAATSPG